MEPSKEEVPLLMHKATITYNLGPKTSKQKSERSQIEQAQVVTRVALTSTPILSTPN